MQKAGNRYLSSLQAVSGDLAPYGVGAVPCDVNRDVRLTQCATGIPARAVETARLYSLTCNRHHRGEKSPAELYIRDIQYHCREAVE